VRFVSQYGKYGVQYRQRRADTDANGVEHVKVEGIYLQFVQGDLFENELAAALERFRFRGQFQHEGEGDLVDPKYRLSTFDTNQQDWPDELREEIEEWLLRQDDPSFFVVETTPIPKPWPAFDEFEGSGEDMVVALDALGYDLQEALDYERLFGKRRPDVIAAIEEALGVETVQA
jgi:hypothetical protein